MITANEATNNMIRFLEDNIIDKNWLDEIYRDINDCSRHGGFRIHYTGSLTEVQLYYLQALGYKVEQRSGNYNVSWGGTI